MLLMTAAALFGLFAVNVVMGAAGSAPFLGDLAEMLVLFATSIFFVAAVLRRERRSKAVTPHED